MEQNWAEFPFLFQVSHLLSVKQGAASTACFFQPYFSLFALPLNDRIPKRQKRRRIRLKEQALSVGEALASISIETTHL
jgi:hypothetical protein